MISIFTSFFLFQCLYDFSLLLFFFSPFNYAINGIFLFLFYNSVLERFPFSYVAVLFFFPPTVFLHAFFFFIYCYSRFLASYSMDALQLRWGPKTCAGTYSRRSNRNRRAQCLAGLLSIARVLLNLYCRKQPTVLLFFFLSLFSCSLIHDPYLTLLA